MRNASGCNHVTHQWSLRSRSVACIGAFPGLVTWVQCAHLPVVFAEVAVELLCVSICSGATHTRDDDDKHCVDVCWVTRQSGHSKTSQLCDERVCVDHSCGKEHMRHSGKCFEQMCMVRLCVCECSLCSSGSCWHAPLLNTSIFLIRLPQADSFL